MAGSKQRGELIVDRAPPPSDHRRCAISTPSNAGSFRLGPIMIALLKASSTDATRDRKLQPKSPCSLKSETSRLAGKPSCKPRCIGTRLRIPATSLASWPPLVQCCPFFTVANIGAQAVSTFIPLSHDQGAYGERDYEQGGCNQ